MEAVAEPTVAPRTAKARFVVKTVTKERWNEYHVTLEGEKQSVVRPLGAGILELHFATGARFCEAHLQPGSTVWVTLEPAD